MAIVSSLIHSNEPHVVRCPTHNVSETRRVVRERHTDHLGNLYERTYGCPDGFDVDVALAAHAAELADQLAAAEIEANIQEVLG